MTGDSVVAGRGHSGVCSWDGQFAVVAPPVIFNENAQIQLKGFFRK